MPFDQLKLDETEQIAGMIDVLFGTLPRLFVIFGQNRRQLEFLEMMPEQNLLLNVQHEALQMRIGNIGFCLDLLRKSGEFLMKDEDLHVEAKTFYERI